MTLRERLADWISGGLVSGYYACRDARVFADAQARDQMGRAYLLQERLNRIAAMETPNCAPIGKRMAKIAREALK
jgi:hypothetical protein